MNERFYELKKHLNVSFFFSNIYFRINLINKFNQIFINQFITFLFNSIYRFRINLIFFTLKLS